MRFHYLGAVLLAACGDPAPDAVEYDDVARMVGSAIATSDGGGTMGAIGDSLVLAFGGMPAGFTYEAGMVTGRHGALDHAYLMIQCRDATNRLMKACTYETNLATLNVTWSGALRLPGLELEASHQGMWTLSSLQQWAPTITGSSQLQLAGTLDGERAYALTATEVQAMVAPGYMMGGTLQLELSVARTGGAEPTDEAVIAAEAAFDAVGSAALTLDGVHRYRVDLATGLLVEP